MIGVQLAQAVFGAGNDVLIGRVIETGANAAFALHNHAVAQAGIGGQHFAKAHFGLMVAVEIRMVEEIHAALQRGHDQRFQAAHVHIGNAHAAHGGAGNGKAGGGFIAFHKRILHNDPK